MLLAALCHWLLPRALSRCTPHCIVRHAERPPQTPAKPTAPVTEERDAQRRETETKAREETERDAAKREETKKVEARRKEDAVKAASEAKTGESEKAPVPGGMCQAEGAEGLVR